MLDVVDAENRQRRRRWENDVWTFVFSIDGCKDRAASKYWFGDPDRATRLGGYSHLDTLTGEAGCPGTLCGTFAAHVVDGKANDETDLIAFAVQLIAGATTFCGKGRPKTFRYMPSLAESLAFSVELTVGCAIRVGPGALPTPASVTGWLGRLGGWISTAIETKEFDDRPRLPAECAR